MTTEETEVWLRATEDVVVPYVDENGVERQHLVRRGQLVPASLPAPQQRPDLFEPIESED